MSTAVKVAELITTCLHCHGKRLYNNWHGEIECLDCGYVHYPNKDFDMPLVKTHRGRKAGHNWRQDGKAA